MKRLLLGFLLISSGLLAQSISVTAPAASATVSGTSYTFKSSCTSCPSLYSTEYDVDGEIAGIAYAGTNYALNWNTFYAANGSQHSVTAIARDAANVTLATSAGVTFSVENALPLDATLTCPGTPGNCSDITVAAPQFTAGYTYSGGVTGSGIQTIGVTGTTPASGTPCASAFGTGTITCNVGAGGNYLAFARRQGTTGGVVTISDGVNTLTCNTTLTVNSNFMMRVCWVIGGTGGSLSFTTAGGTGAGNIMVVPLTGTGLAIDTSVEADVASVSLTTVQSLGFTPTPTELVYEFGSIQGSARTFTPSAGYSLVTQDGSGGNGQVYSHLYSNSTLFGNVVLAVTANGPNATAAKDVTVYLDGTSVASTTGNTANPITFTINSTSVSDGAHRMVIDAFATNLNCPNCFGGTWNWLGGYEGSISFTQPAATFQQLLASTTDIYLVPTGSNQSGTACTAVANATWASGVSACDLSGIDKNTDGTTNAATITCASGDMSVVTIASTCTAVAASPAVGYGFTQITLTDTVNSVTRTVNVWNLASNVVSHFNSNGTVRNGVYSAGNSFLHLSLFGLQATQPSWSTAAYCTMLHNTGITTAEPASVPVPAAFGTSEAAWDASADALINPAATALQNCGIKAHLIFDSFFGGTPNMFPTEYGACAGFTTKCLTYVLNKWNSYGILMGASGVDEVSSSWGGSPLQGIAGGGLKLGVDFNLSGNGTTCAFSSVPTAIGLNGGHRFILTYSNPADAGYAQLHYDPTAPATFTNSSGSINTGTTFACSYNGGTITPAGTITLEPYVFATFDNSFNQFPAGSTPWPNYIKYDVFQQIRNQQLAATNPSAMAWPSVAGTGFRQWTGYTVVSGTRTADYGEWYWTSGGAAYLPGHVSLSTLNTVTGTAQIADFYRLFAPNARLDAPILFETAGGVTVYSGGTGGIKVPIASCSGDTITTTVPHGLSNVMDWSSRLWIPNTCQNVSPTTLNGAINASVTSLTVTSAAGITAPVFMLIDNEMIYCATLATNTFSNCVREAAQDPGAAASHSNGATVTWYQLDYIMATPTATTLRVYTAWAMNSIPNIGATTATFDDGNVYSLTGLSLTTGNPSNRPPGIITAATCAVNVERGHTFTATGASGTFYFPWYNADTCNAGNMRTTQMENMASASPAGAVSAYIIPSNAYLRGQNFSGNSEEGARYTFANSLSPMMAGGSGSRTYQTDISLACPDFFDRTGTWSSPTSPSSFDAGYIGYFFFNNTLAAGAGSNYQIGASPDCHGANLLFAWYAMALANLTEQSLVPFSFQARIPSPDLGKNFATHATYSSSVGNALYVQSFADGPLARTVTLTPYDIGHDIYRECASARGMEDLVKITTGTTTDTVTYDPGEFCAYLFETVPGTYVQQVVVPTSLSLFSGAAKTVFQIAPSAFAWNQSILGQAYPRAVDCGSAATCTLPINHQIGTIYYRELWINSSGAVIASTDTQSL